MSKADKWFTRKQQIRNRQYCTNTVLKDFEKDDDGEYRLEDGKKIPVWDFCQKKMKPRKLNNYIQWTCAYCGTKKYTQKEISALRVEYDRKEKQ